MYHYALAAVMVAASVLPGLADPLAEHLWRKRPIVVFAPARDDPRLTEQLDRLAAAGPAIEERDGVVVIDTVAGSALRERFEPGPFTVVLIGKDGTEKARRDEPIPAEHLLRLIDSTPVRQREMDED